MKKHLLSVIFAYLLCFQASAQVNLTNGLYFCYPLNGNATDYSGNGNNGTVTGCTATTDRFNNPSGALLFNGTSSDFARVNTMMPDMARFSISVWVYNTKPSGASALFIDSNTAPFLDMGFNMTSTSINAWGNKPGGTLTSSGPTGLNLNNAWHHIVWVCDSINQKFYVDNVLVSTLNTTGTNIGYHNVMASIGRQGDDPGNLNYNNFFQGKMDDMRFFSRAINAAEVTALFNAKDCSCFTPDAATSIDGDNTPCVSSSETYTTVYVSGATYSWTLPNGWLGTSTTNSISGVPGSAGTISVTIITACGNVGPLVLNVSPVDCTSGLKEKTNAELPVSIYPNPTHGNFTIETKEAVSLKITNIIGKILLEEKTITGKNKIDLSKEANGIYFVEVKQGGLSKTLKIIKE